jgi:hypothetical protein
MLKCVGPWLWFIFSLECKLALHVPFKTLVMAYVYIETCMALAMVYIFVKMHLTPYVPFKTLAIVYILIIMCMFPSEP